MAPLFLEIINSRLFKFIVGKTINGSLTEFLVHEEAISQLSKPLHTLIKGDLSEAQAGCTIWREVSKETFERFVQFVYTSDYSIPNTREWVGVADPQKEDTDVSKVAPAEEKPTEGYNSIDELQNPWPTGRKAKKDKRKSKGAGGGFGGYGGWGTAPSEPEPVPEPEPDSWLGSTPVIRTSRDIYPDSPPPWPSSTDFHSLQCPLLAPRNIHHHTCEPAGHFEPD